MESMTKVAAIQISAHILMYGYLYIVVSLEDNEIRVAAFPEGYSPDVDTMPITHEQAVSIIQKALEVIDKQDDIPDDDGDGSECAVGVYDKEGQGISGYDYPDTLKYYAFGKIGRMINEVYDSDVVTDFLNMGGY